VRASADGATLLCFEAHEFEALLLMAPEFCRALLAQLALRLEALYAHLGPADHRVPTPP
jgi:CRP-like cAMP-binding protein